MAADNYRACLDHVLRSEGGYVNHPKDPGGETKYGITRRTARAHGYHGSMRTIPMSVVEGIYRKGFWDAIKGDSLPAGLDLAVFDFAVNSGPSRAKHFAATLQSLPVDEAISELCHRRLAWLKTRKTWRTFGRGWKRRVLSVMDDARAMAVRASVHTLPLPAMREGDALARSEDSPFRGGPLNESH